MDLSFQEFGFLTLMFSLVLIMPQLLQLIAHIVTALQFVLLIVRMLSIFQLLPPITHSLTFLNYVQIFTV